MERQRVLVVLPWIGRDERQNRRGVNRYARQQADWDLIAVEPSAFLDRQPAAWGDVAGLVGRLGRTDLARQARRFDCPTVNIYGSRRALGLPQLGVDDRAIGRLAAEHLIERGLRHFAAVGFTGGRFSAERIGGFEEALKRRGFRASTRTLRHFALYADDKPNPIMPWLERLPKPCGLFAIMDFAATHVIALARCARLRVPDDLAVVGSGNDDVEWDSVKPPLSSVDCPSETEGFLAAELLDQMMKGRRAPRSPILLQPLGVLARGSTNVLAIEDELVKAAISFARKNAALRLTVPAIAREVAVSRRSLERRFRLALGPSPLEMLRRVRVELAKELLSSTNEKLPVIASRTGFGGADQLSRAFIALTGMKPQEFRALSRGRH